MKAPPDASAPARTRGGHLPALDGVRGLAILVVFLHNTNPIAQPASLLQKLVGTAVDWGWVGVQLFFVLSGFLITGILLDTARAANYYPAFFARRVLRIFPLYYGVLVVAFVLVPLIFGHPIEGYREQAWFWTYLANWSDPFGHEIPAFPHFWSLAVEEQFYLFWPFVVRAGGKRGVLWVGGVLTVAALVSRIALLRGGFSPAGPYSFTICRVDALVLGGMAAVLLRDAAAMARIEAHRRAIGWATLGLFLVGAVATRGYPRVTFATQTAGYTILALVFTVFVLFAALGDLRGATRLRWLRARWLRTLGKYSYGFYVLHVPVVQFIGVPLLRRFVVGPDVTTLVALPYMAAVFAVSFAAAVASYHLFEKHFLALKPRFVARAGVGMGVEA